MKPLSERLTDRELIQRGDLTLAFRARDAVLERQVFVKALNPALAGDAEIRARFEREARAVARLDHPNLVRIYEYGEDPNEGLFMLLEWIDGASLGTRLRDGRKFAPADLRNLASQLLRGLGGLHSVGILHRDLKPDNILISAAPDQDGEHYKITDFSLAALRDAPRLTHHEAIVGTPAYMAPEQAAGGLPTGLSDLYSLGVVLYEAATGENPFTAPTLLETLRRVREEEPSFDKPALSELPEPTLNLLRALLRKNPTERPATANDARRMLGEKVLKPHYRESSKRRNAAFLSAALAVVAIWAVGMIYWPWEDRTEPTPTRLISTPATTPARTDTAASVSASTVQPVASEPEFRAPATPKTTESTGVQESRDTSRSAIPDSADVLLNTEPWAHVFWHGTQLGTTPLAAPMRLPHGHQILSLRNPAFPPVEIELNIDGRSMHPDIRLADYAALVHVSVEPWGELYLDGEHVGTTPLPRPLFVSPGRHTVRVAHPQFPAQQQEFQAVAGETLALRVDLPHEQASVKNSSGGAH